MAMRDTIYLYTDGASSGNPGPGGWGAVLKCGDLRKEMSGGFALTTNNRMELLAVIKGLETILWENAEVEVWSEITYDNDEAYIKTEYLQVLTDEEAAAELEAQEQKEIEDALKVAEEKQLSADEAVAQAAAAAQAQLAQQQAQPAADANAQAAADAAALQAAAEAQAAAELAAQQAAAAQAAAAQQAAGGLTPIHCKDGTCYVTAAQLNTIHATWDFAGDAIEMAGHHNIGELEAVIGPTQH